MCKPAVALQEKPTQGAVQAVQLQVRLKLEFSGRKDPFGHERPALSCTGRVTGVTSWGEVKTDIPSDALAGLSNGERVTLRLSEDGSNTGVLTSATFIANPKTRILSGRKGIQCVDDKGNLMLSVNNGVAVRALGISEAVPLAESILGLRFV